MGYGRFVLLPARVSSVNDVAHLLLDAKKKGVKRLCILLLTTFAIDAAAVSDIGRATVKTRTRKCRVTRLELLGPTQMVIDIRVTRRFPW